MIVISQVKLPCGAPSKELEKKIRGRLKLSAGDKFTWRITRHAVDARKKPELFDIYSVSVLLGDERRENGIVRRLKDDKIRFEKPVQYTFPVPSGDNGRLKNPPVVVGAGPAGLFCSLYLAENGYRPILLERGKAMEERIRDVTRFWEGGDLDPESNCQFGEGGAGTFSDGKLTTGIKDKSGRIEEVIRRFIEAGAPEDIAYENLPHIGTDKLRSVIISLRERIIRAGGTVIFGAKVTDLLTDESTGRIRGVVYVRDGKAAQLDTQVLVLAPGHSARDLIRTLHKNHVRMEQKNFAVGFRVSHPQEMIDFRQYGVCGEEKMKSLNLSHASYKLTAKASSGRGVYSFCMCPGGYVVNASSQEGRLTVNGMSDYARDSARANSAIVMTVSAGEFGSDDPLAGMLFQEALEQKAYSLAGGRIPVRRYADLKADFLDGSHTGHKEETEASEISTEEAEDLCIRGQYAGGDLASLYPEDLTRDFIEAMEYFDGILPGFAGEKAFVMGPESRTSSPVRILREKNMEGSVGGLIPCGEGAGYAGGIMSAAVDGIKAAEAVAAGYYPAALQG